MTLGAQTPPRPGCDYSAQNERGASLIEAMVAMLLMTLVLLSLGHAMGSAMKTTARGGQDLRLWADVQRKADSLTALSADSVASGSDVVGGRTISWTVSGSNPIRVDLAADRQMVGSMDTTQYNLILFLRK